MADTRTGKRFPVQLPIRIRVGNSADEQAGTTANISASGVYMRAEAPARRKPASSGRRQTLRPGTVVEFEMTLPAEIIGARHDVNIQCRGRVVRVEKLGPDRQRDGVACVIDKYEFVRKA